MLNQPPEIVETGCPTRDEWREALRGHTSHQRWLEIEAHFQACPSCEATVDALTELSDTCVRELCRGPSTADDEPVFQSLYSKLLTSSQLAIQVDNSIEVSPMPLPFRLGNYELLSPLGQGANGNVFHARHVPLDRDVVIKLLKPNQDFDPARVDRFIQEVRTVGQLDHPHIVRATDAGETDNQHFLVMEYVPGVDLSSVLAACSPLRVCDVCEIIRQSTLGLAYLHDNGFVHRDIKPSNLLLTASGQTKLMDLGLVHYVGNRKVADGAHPQPPHGTADYMSPEQWLDFDCVDYRSDLYSLGCTLYKLLTGTPPYRPLPAGFATRSAAHCAAPLPQLRAIRADVPDALQKIFERLVAKRPEDRCATAREVAEKLLPLTRGSNLGRLAAEVGLPTSPEAPRAWRPLWWNRRWTRREAVLATALAICGVVMGGSLATRLIVPAPSLAQYLQTDSWRALQPATPPLFVSLDESAHPASYRVDTDSVQICSHRLTLLGLGQPVVGTFRMAVDLAMPIGHYNAGLFFEFVEEIQPGSTNQRCQSIEFVQDTDSVTGLPRTRLVWCALRIDEGSRSPVTRTLLTEIDVDPPADEARLEVELGSDGYPLVVWCGEPLPLDRWRTVSYEAREGAAAFRSRRQAGFPGQIGVLAGTEEPVEESTALPQTTEFRHAKLKYQVR